MKYVFINKRYGLKRRAKVTDYYIGDDVYIDNMGSVYSTYRAAYEQLGLNINKVSRSYCSIFGERNLPSFKTFKVVGFVYHETVDDLLVGLKNEDTDIIVSYEGLRKAHRFGAINNDIDGKVIIKTEYVAKRLY